MNTTQKTDILDEMLNELNNANNTKKTQMGYISDITDKANNILLQIEASQKAKASQQDPESKRYVYNKNALQSLAKTVESFEGLVNIKTASHQNSPDFESYITTTRTKIDFLGSAVRKLLALNDTVNQIRSELHNDSDDYDLDSSDTLDGASSD